MTNGTDRTDALAAKIRDRIALHFGLSPAELLKKRRYRQVAWPRHVAIALVDEATGGGKALVGRLFDREPSALYDARRSVANNCLAHPELSADLGWLRQLVARMVVAEKEAASPNPAPNCLVRNQRQGVHLERRHPLMLDV